MFKKIFYSLTILAMLVGMFGVMGKGGVQRAAAADSAPSWYDGAPADAALPIYQGNLDMTTGNGSAVGDRGGCSALGASSFGFYQSHLLDNVAAIEPAGFYRVRVVSDTDTDSYLWAVLVRNAATNVELGCAVAVGGVVDLTVPVGKGVDVIVTVASIGAYVPTDATYETFVARFVNGGGLIVDMRADVGNVAGRDVEATNVADVGTAKFTLGDWDTNGFMVNFLDIPDGTYNLGIQDQTADAEFAAYYHGPEDMITASGIFAVTPDADSDIPLEVRVYDMADAPFNVDNVMLTPTEFGLNSDLELGPTGVGLEPDGFKTFRVNYNPPTYDDHWDLAVLYENGDEVVFFYELNVNPILGTLIFWGTQKVPAEVLICADAGYDAGGITLDPAGQLEDRDFTFIPGGGGECDLGYGGKAFFLSSNEFVEHHPYYEVTELFLVESGWTYFYEPLGGPFWSYPPMTSPSAEFYIGDDPFVTTPVGNATSQEEYALPLTGGQVALMRGPWTDQFGNKLVQILDDVGDDIFPEYWLETVSTAAVLLANDWLTSSLGPITDVGRYRYWRELQHGPNLPNTVAAGWFSYNDLFAISPSDTPMLGHWAWSWVEAMYELGYTNGIGGGAYGPDQTMTRAQMAVFLSTVMSDISTIPAAGACTGTVRVFTDVGINWACGAIEQLADLGITSGMGDGTFAPEAAVTRAQMSKFIQLTFRAIVMYGGTTWWDVNQNVLAPGNTFVDVPANHWANLWIEEMVFDGLTSGCTYDNGIWYFCPEPAFPGDTQGLVTRGQMAKFIVTALQSNAATQGFWPVLAPER